LCIPASPRIPWSDLGWQTPHFWGGSITGLQPYDRSTSSQIPLEGIESTSLQTTLFQSSASGDTNALTMVLVVSSIPGHLGRPEARSKWSGTSIAQHEDYRAVPARGPLRDMPGLWAKPIGLSMARPDLADRWGLVVGPVSPTQHNTAHPINIV
jgi:hypothetical protein